MSVSRVTTFVPESPAVVRNHNSAHIVQFYRESRALVEALTKYIGNALTSGDAAVVIATEAHRDALENELSARGLDVGKAHEQGRYVWFDPNELLSQFMSDGMPDAAKFSALMGGVIERATSAARSDGQCVAMFGEMVALLWLEGKQAAAIRLEQLWNDLAKAHSFTLRCAYPMNGFSKSEHSEPFLKICEEHSAVVPEESYQALSSGEGRAQEVAVLQQRLEALEKQKALHDSQQQLQLLVEAVQDYAIFMLDADGRVKTWNAGAQRIKGYAASEIIGKHFSCFYFEEDLESGKPGRELEIAARDGRVEDEGWRIRKDGSKFWANVVITALKDSRGVLIGFTKVTRDFTERMLAEQNLRDAKVRLEESEKSLRELSLHLLRTQDEERRRIGRDLHDSLGQYLSVLKMKLDGLATSVSKDQPADPGELQQCAQLTEDAVKEVRTISYLLYPPMLEEMGLSFAIPWYLEGFTKRSGIKTTFEISPELGRMTADVELVFFRVLQESLTNVHRHSGSETAAVKLFVKDGSVVLEVSDRGKGTQARKFEEGGADWMGALGVGLRGMNERVRQIGGRLELHSSGEGTTVAATVPLETAREREAAAAQ
jgi:PAS domain S-box-containing protein